MPRFAPATTNILKAAMALRAPNYVFVEDDFEHVSKLTGMARQQIMKWADNFRERFQTQEERVNFLSSDAAEKVC